MVIPATCTNCGRYIPDPGVFAITGNVRNISFKNMAVSCPYCGGKAEIRDGTYDFINSVLTAFRAPGVQRSDIVAFQGIAQAVQAGDISEDDAANEIKKIGNVFSKVWDERNTGIGALGLLLSIIALWMAYTSKESSDASGVQAHLDALQQAQFQQKIYETLLQRRPANGSQEAPVSPKGQTITPYSARSSATPTSMNRHERRKAARLGQR